MRWRDDEQGFGAVSVSLHWLVALAVFGLFGLGLWMTGLTYYDAWYLLGPWWHKGIGALLSGVMVLRVGWRLSGVRPQALPSHRPWERISARMVHRLLELMVFAVIISGYLIVTAEGKPLTVFDWFAIPALVSGLEQQEDIAGQLHLVLASALVGLAALHALAALKHHFIDKDRTLARMLGW